MSTTNQLTLYSRLNLTGTLCEVCGQGSYQETSIYDDWEGKLHCTKCNHEIERLKEIW